MANEIKAKKKLTSFSRIFVDYRSKLEYYVRSIVSPQDIDDIVQETFVRTYEAHLKKDIQYPRTFMLRTVRNIALNHVQRWDNKFGCSIEDLTEPLVHLQTATLEAQMESKERFLDFCRATDQLPEQCKKTFILKKVYGLSQKEIAQYLNISESTVEKHVAKGLAKSLEYMEQLDNPTSDNQAENAIVTPHNKQMR